MPALLVLCSPSPICRSLLFSPAIHWNPWVILIPCPHIFVVISFCLIFPVIGLLAVLPLASLFRTLLNCTPRDREAVAQPMWLSPHPNLFPPISLFFFFTASHVLVACHPLTMDLRDGWQEQKLDTSPSVSSDSSWTSFDLSTDLTSVSSDQVSTPVAASSGCELFGQSWSLLWNKVSSGKKTRVFIWRETSFLGNEE